MPTASTERRRLRFYALGVCGLLLLAVAMVYGQTLGFGALDYDDLIFVFGNPHVSTGITAENLRWALTNGPGGEWYPLAMISHMLDCQVYGSQAWGHHLTGVLLHAATAIGLFLVLWRMTAEIWPSAFAAALFAVHPQRVESVAWIAERRDVLSGLMLVLTLAAYLGYVRQGRGIWRWTLVAVAMTLGLMAKATLVTVPAVLVLLDFWPLARLGKVDDAPGWTAGLKRPSVWSLVGEKLPLVVPVAVVCLVTMRTHVPAPIQVPLEGRLANIPVAYVGYLAQFFYPHDLVVFYPWPIGGYWAWHVIAAAAALLAVSVAAIVWRRRCPWLLVGWFWFLGMMLPVSGVMGASHFMADRYMYLPGIGLCIAIAWGAARLAARLKLKAWAMTCGAVAVVAVLMGCAEQQTSHWMNEETLWQHALDCIPDNPQAEFHLARELASQGRYDEAIVLYKRAQPRFYDARVFTDLGALLDRLGRHGEAMQEYRLAVEKAPQFPPGHLNLGIALATGKKAEAARQFRLVPDSEPEAIVAHRALGRLELDENKLADAEQEMLAALALAPHDAGALNELGFVLERQGKIDAAIERYQAALSADADYLLAHVNLGRVLAMRGQNEAALTHCRRALELDPENQTARTNSAGCWVGPGRRPNRRARRRLAGLPAASAKAKMDRSDRRALAPVRRRVLHKIAFSRDTNHASLPPQDSRRFAIRPVGHRRISARGDLADLRTDARFRPARLRRPRLRNRQSASHAGLTAEGIRWAWTAGPFGEWYPLATMSHMLDCQLFGLNAWGHHLASVLVPLRRVARVVFGLVADDRRTFAQRLRGHGFCRPSAARRKRGLDRRTARRVERTVLHAHARGLPGLCAARPHARRRYLLVATLFALGLVSKPMLVTVPALLLLLDYWPLARIGSPEDAPQWSESVERPGAWRLVLEKLPLMALAAADCLMTLRTHFAALSAPLGWSGRIGNAAVSCVTYLAQFLYPVGLAAHYPLTPGGPPAWKAAGAIAILLAISAAAIVWRRRCPYVFVGWFWYLGMLTPVLGLVQIADHAMADRYLYLPGIGLDIALAWGARGWLPDCRRAGGCSSPEQAR